MGNEPVQTNPVLEVRQLIVDYVSTTGLVHAVDNISCTIQRGEIFGLAGESGSGKSTLAFAIARLLKFPAQIAQGEILYYPRDGARPINILELGPRALRQFRWSELAIVFQSAMNALNPVMDIATQIDDVIRAHDPHMSRAQRRDRAAELMRLVGIAPDRLRSFPHQLSGGMRQRAVIALALALHPDLIIMDEPTTALDVVVQREILNEVRALQQHMGFAVIFITHDLSLLLEISQHLAIMYAGRMVELAPQAALFTQPLHPYAYGLLHAFPSLYGARKVMLGIPGHPPDLRQLPAGCPFAPRCAWAFGACRSITPRLRQPDPAVSERQVACHLYDPAHHPAPPPASVDPALAAGDLLAADHLLDTAAPHPTRLEPIS